MASPQVSIAVKIHKISCPYCLIGYAEMVEERRDGQMQIQGIKDPRKCVTCHKYFRLKPKVQIVGVPMEDGNNGKH
jgi:ferredoxin